jgi:hypothetical protein
MERKVGWLVAVSEDLNACYIDWQEFSKRYGGMDAKAQGRVLREIFQCHEERVLADGEIVKVSTPACFTEATDGTQAR